MQQLGKIRYRKKRGHPCLYLICAFHPESSDKIFFRTAKEKCYRGRSSDLLHFFAAFPSAEGGQWLSGSKKAHSGANSIG
jgi:hypothetical protein